MVIRGELWQGETIATIHLRSSNGMIATSTRSSADLTSLNSRDKLRVLLVSLVMPEMDLQEVLTADKGSGNVLTTLLLPGLSLAQALIKATITIHGWIRSKIITSRVLGEILEISTRVTMKETRTIQLQETVMISVTDALTDRSLAITDTMGTQEEVTEVETGTLGL